MGEAVWNWYLAETSGVGLESRGRKYKRLPRNKCVGNPPETRWRLYGVFSREQTRLPLVLVPSQLTINYFQRQRGTKRMVDMFFEFTELCTTIPPLEYGGNEVLLETFAAKVPWLYLK